MPRSKTSFAHTSSIVPTTSSAQVSLVLKPSVVRALSSAAIKAFKEECHKAAGGTLVESLLQDLRYALRLLRKSPAFTAVAVVTLALGIGANAVVFSVLNALILRPLNVPHSQDLFMIEREVRNSSTPQQSYPDYVDLRDRNRSFDGLMAYAIVPASLNITGNASSIWLYRGQRQLLRRIGCTTVSRPLLPRLR